MIIKEMDEHAAELATIERLLQSELPEAISHSLTRDRRSLLSALKQERDSAYHLDVYFTDSPDWALFHDLRLEMGEESAQIDHLLIGRQLDIYLIDSKHYNADIKVSREGEFVYLFNKKPVAMVSPLERNSRHIELLARYLESNDLLPNRFGLTIRPRFHNVVLTSPASRISLADGTAMKGGEVVPADRFLERFSRNPEVNGLSDLVAVARQIPAESLQTLAAKLARRHIPRSIDFAERYGLKHQDRYEEPEDCSDGCNCARCNRRVSARVARYCRDNRELFAGRVYCFDCQKGLAFQP
jgi:hypothetical protein